MVKPEISNKVPLHPNHSGHTSHMIGDYQSQAHHAVQRQQSGNGNNCYFVFNFILNFSAIK